MPAVRRLARCLVFVALIVACAGAGSCSLVVGEEPLSVVEVAGPPVQPLVLEGNGRLRDAFVLLGVDGAPWLAVAQTYQNFDLEVRAGYIVSRLRPPFTAEKVLGLSAVFPPVPARAYCTIDGPDLTGGIPVSMRRPGDPEVHTVVVPPKPTVLCGQRTMVAFAQNRANRVFELVRRQASGKVIKRTLPWPQDANPDWDQGPRAFDDNEEILIITDAEYRTHLRYLDSGEDYDLGLLFWGEGALGYFVFIDADGALHAFSIAERKRVSLGYRLSSEGNIIGLDAAHESVLTCDWDGLRSLSLRPHRPGLAEMRLLDPRPCSSTSSTLVRRSGAVQYDGEDGMHSAPLDGSAPARTIWQGVEGVQLLSVCGDGSVAYSLDPKERYGLNVGDGWIGSSRFMERGRDARFSPDCSRIRFKERAANLRRLGELRSLTLQTRAARFLARNVGFYAELPDGRLLATDNLAVIGSHNRLVLIDEDAGTSRTLMTGPTAVTGALPLGSLLSDAAARNEVILEVDTPELRGPRRLVLLTLPPG